MKKYILAPEDPSLWPEEFKAKMEQGLFCPVDADLDETRLPPDDLTRRYVAFLVVLSQNKYVFSPRLLSEMPKLNLEMATAKRGAAGAPGPDTSGGGYDQLPPVGVAQRRSPPPDWALQIKFSQDRLGALERRTHVEQHVEDPMDPVLFTQIQFDEQILAGPCRHSGHLLG